MSAPPSLVSVVITCYNQAHFLGEAIESVLAQSYTRFEIIVVDDGSKDNTPEVASGYPQVRYIRQNNQGVSVARNVGLCQAKGRYLVFVDGDDRLLPEALQIGAGSLPDDAKIVGMVGRVAPQKDYATLAKAAARVVAADPSTRFLIVGGYSEPKKNREHYDKVQRMLAASDVAPYFIFTDFRHDVPRLISAMDVFVLSTHFEGLPVVILEAIAQSKPVVATSVDGVPEVVIDGKNGLLFPHQDDEKMAAQLLTLLKDKAYAAGLGEAGRQFVKTNFSRDQFVTNMINLYGEMLHIAKARSASA